MFDTTEVVVNTSDLIELRDDLTEAIHAPRGYAAVDVMVQDLLPKDLIYVLGNHYTITNLLSAQTMNDETEWIIQFNDGAFREVGCEVVMPGDEQVTVYRRVE